MSSAVDRTQERATQAPPRIRLWRVVLIGLLLVPVNVWYLLYMEMARRVGGPSPSVFSLSANCILFLVALAALNAAVERLSPRLALRQAEVLIVYVMLMISTAMWVVRLPGCSRSLADVAVPCRDRRAGLWGTATTR